MARPARRIDPLAPNTPVGGSPWLVQMPDTGPAHGYLSAPTPGATPDGALLVDAYDPARHDARYSHASDNSQHNLRVAVGRHESLRSSPTRVAGVIKQTPFADFWSVPQRKRLRRRTLPRGGIPERVSMKWTGHKTRSVFERYNIVSDGDLADAAVRLETGQPQPRHGHAP